MLIFLPKIGRVTWNGIDLNENDSRMFREVTTKFSTTPSRQILKDDSIALQIKRLVPY
jgi:hypothetical protein